MALERLVTWLRGRRLDRVKAQNYLAEQANAAFRELAGDYDQFIEHVQHAKAPSSRKAVSACSSAFWSFKGAP